MTKLGTHNKFPDSVWDGLCYQYDNITDDQNPSFFWADAVSQELIAVENYLIDYDDWFHLFNHPGSAGSFLSIKNDLSGGIWRSLVAGTNITLTPGYNTLTINAEGSAEFEVTAGESWYAGMPIYCHAGPIYMRGDNSTDLESRIIGLAKDDASLGSTTAIVLVGRVNRADWTPVTGTTTLTVGSYYWLGTNGSLISSPPTTGFVAPVGLAVSSSEMKVEISTRIQI